MSNTVWFDAYLHLHFFEKKIRESTKEIDKELISRNIVFFVSFQSTDTIVDQSTIPLRFQTPKSIGWIENG